MPRQSPMQSGVRNRPHQRLRRWLTIRMQHNITFPMSAPQHQLFLQRNSSLTALRHCTSGKIVNNKHKQLKTHPIQHDLGVRPSCVAVRRCGSSLALPETQCLHQEQNQTCVSSCLSSSSTVGPGGGFRALATGASTLSCMTGSAEGGASCLFSSITGFPAICSTCSTGCSLLSVIMRCTPPVPALGRSIQNASTRCFQRLQWCLVANPSSLW